MGVEIHAVDQFGRAADDAVEVGRGLVGLGVPGVFRSHPDEDQALAFGHRIAADADARGVHLLTGHQGGDLGADPVGSKSPAMIGTFHRLGLAVAGQKLAGGQGRGAVGADVAKRIDGAGALAAEQDRLAHDLVSLQLGGLQVRAQGGEVPDVVQEALTEGFPLGLGCLGSGRLGGAGVAFGHAFS
jgi:hypothetical protein